MPTTETRSIYRKGRTCQPVCGTWYTVFPRRVVFGAARLFCSQQGTPLPIQLVCDSD